MATTTPLTVQAACGEGKIPSYSDISSIAYGRSGCLRKCPAYEVDFGYRYSIASYSGARCLYVGLQNVAKHGTYFADCSQVAIPEAVAVLERGRFYDINWDSSIEVTDAQAITLIVKRCGVTTSLEWPEHGSRKDITALAAALDHITNSFRWEKASNDVRDLLWKPGMP